MFLLRYLVTIKGEFVSIRSGFKENQEIVISFVIILSDPWALSVLAGSEGSQVLPCALWDVTRALWSRLVRRPG